VYATAAAIAVELRQQNFTGDSLRRAHQLENNNGDDGEIIINKEKKETKPTTVYAHTNTIECRHHNILYYFKLVT